MVAGMIICDEPKLEADGVLGEWGDVAIRLVYGQRRAARPMTGGIIIGGRTCQSPKCTRRVL